MHDDEVRNPRRIGSRVSFSAGKTKVKQCVVLRRRRVLVLWRVSLVIDFKNVRNLLLINHNDGFFDDDEFVLYDLFASKKLDFPYDSYAPFDLKELDESEFRRASFWKTRYSNSEGSFANPKHDYLQSAFCLWWEGLCMLLKRLSYPCRYRGMIHRFAKPVPVLSMITNQTIDYVYNVHGNRVLNWNHEVLSPVNLQTYVDALTARGAPLPNCFGFIDGTVRPISRPREHQRLLYNGHKRVHALKFQSIALPNGLIGNLCGPVGKLQNSTGHQL